MLDEDFVQLVADAERRIEGRHGVLVHHGDLFAADRLELLRALGQDVLAFEQHPPTGDTCVALQITERGEGNRALAAARLADQPDCLTAVDIQ